MIKPDSARRSKTHSFARQTRQLCLLALVAIGSATHGHASESGGDLQLIAPSAEATACSNSDFGAMQIRVGLHATLQACYRDVAVIDGSGAAFVTIPREFEDKAVSRDEFNALRADVVRTENAVYEESRRARQNSKPTPQLRPRPIPLGIFDHDDNRVGYAYAYAVTRNDGHGGTVVQSMMRLESFVLVGNRVIVLMLIAPVHNGDDAADVFNVGEQWARSIVQSNSRTSATRSGATHKLPDSPESPARAKRREFS